MILSLLQRSGWPSSGSPGMEGHDFTPPPLLSFAGRMLKRGVGLMYTNASDANIAPVDSSTEGLMWVTLVDTVVLSLSFMGSLSILISMLVLELKGRPSTTRMRIVQALILSDLMLGIVGLIGSAIELSPYPLQEGTTECSGLGFMLVAVLWTEHLWTLILAIVTYLILIHPLATLTIILERRWYWLWCVVWIGSFTVSIVGLEVYGYFPSGGICYYGQNAGLYQELIQFIPRAIVFLVISVLYARLYVFLRRPDKIHGSFSSHSGSRNHHKVRAALHFTHRTEHTDADEEKPSTHFMSFITTRRVSDLIKGRPGFTSEEKMPEVIAIGVERRPSVKPVLAEDEEGVEVRDYAAGSKSNRRSSAPDVMEHAGERQRRPTMVLSPLAEEHHSPSHPPLHLDTTQPPSTSPPMSPKSPKSPLSSPTIEIPPWERLELPAFEIDGQRYGGSGGDVHRSTSSLWGGWKGLGGRTRNRPGTGGSTHSQTGSTTGRLKRSEAADALRSSIGSVSLTPAVSPGLHTATMPSPLDNPSIARRLSPPRPRPDSTGATPVRRASFAPDHEIIERKDHDFEPERVRKASCVSSPLSEGHTAHSDDEGEDDGDGEGDGDGGSEDSPGATAVDRDERTSKSRDNLEADADQYHRTSSTFVAAERASAEGSRRSSASGPSKSQLASRKSSHTGDSLYAPLSLRDTGIPVLPRPTDVEKGEHPEEDEEEDALWDFGRMLAADASTRRSTNGNGEGSAKMEEETYELVQESMASYLNRKTALLMLWFPLGYVLLFSVSLIRVIYDFAGDPPPALRAISRWFIFAQGILDALIYGLVEWHTKRVVRKRVRKGTFSPSASGSGSALHHAFRHWNKSHRRTGGTQSHPEHTGGGFSGVFSGTTTNPRMTSTVGGVTSRVGDTRNILQELGLDRGGSRRGSGPPSVISPSNSPAVPTEKTMPNAGAPGTVSQP